MHMNNNWQGVYGQESAKQILEKIISSRKIPHAFLFQGAEGTGKEFMAIRFAQLLNSGYSDVNKKEAVWRHIQNLEEPFVKFIFPLPRGKNENENSGPTEKLSAEELSAVREEINKKSHNPYYGITVPRATNIKINSIRDIKKFLAFEYEDIAYRVIIISEANLMNEEAQNALLKSLEEPPEGVVFILTTALPSSLRETIRSRCWNINFQPLSYENTADILQRYYNVEDSLSQKIAPFTGGSVRNALNLIDNDFEKLLEKTIFILRYSFGRKYHSALEEFSSVIKENNTETLELLIQLIVVWLNDFQKYRIDGSEFYFSEYYETLEKFYKRFPDLDVSSTVYKLDRLSSLIKKNVNLNLIILNIVFELSVLVLNNRN